MFCINNTYLQKQFMPQDFSVHSKHTHANLSAGKRFSSFSDRWYRLSLKVKKDVIGNFRNFEKFLSFYAKTGLEKIVPEKLMFIKYFDSPKYK